MPSSKLYPGEQIIDDTSPSHVTDTPAGMSKGYMGMFASPESGQGFSALDPQWKVPRSEWQARCEELESTQSRISDLIVQAKIPPKNQGQTNYCWVNAPTGCVEVMRAVQGEKYVSLSPASAGAQIKGYKNQGGWGQEALEWIAEKGLVPSANWGDNIWNNRNLATSANKTLALNYRAEEWDKLASGAIDETASCAFHRKPTAVGYNWWSHEVYVCDPVWLDGELAFRCRNSWGDISGYPNGFFVLRGSKMIPDDAVCPRAVTAS